MIDRRGRDPERLICRSDDVILTYRTDNGQKDFHVIERYGDDLARCCAVWPDIDREGAYKNRIEEMRDDLVRSMAIARSIIPYTLF